MNEWISDEKERIPVNGDETDTARHDVPGIPGPVLDLLESAWDLMTTAHASDDQAPPGWMQSAEDWRERYHAFLEGDGADIAQPDLARMLSLAEEWGDSPLPGLRHAMRGLQKTRDGAR